MAEEEDCVLQLPVLLAPPPSSVKKYQSLIEADYNYPPSRRGNVFDLQNAVLDAVSNLASTLEIPSDGLEVAVYEVRRMPLHLSHFHPTFPTVKPAPSIHRRNHGKHG